MIPNLQKTCKSGMKNGVPIYLSTIFSIVNILAYFPFHSHSSLFSPNMCI